MAKTLNFDLVTQVAFLAWDQMVGENPAAFDVNEKGELFIPKGIEEYRFGDFADEVRLELAVADGNN